MRHPLLDRPGHLKPRTPSFVCDDFTDSGDNTLLTVPSGYAALVFYFMLSNGGEDQIELEVKFGSTVQFGYYLKGGATALQNFIGAEPQSINSNIVVNLGADGTVKASMGYLLYPLTSES